jgi:hypothetical protein
MVDKCRLQVSRATEVRFAEFRVILFTFETAINQCNKTEQNRGAINATRFLRRACPFGGKMLNPVGGHMLWKTLGQQGPRGTT